MSEGFPSPSRDFCDEPGAIALKAIIEAYWRARGFIVTVKLEGGGFLSVMRARRCDVRSDLINGWPRRSLPKAETQEAA